MEYNNVHSNDYLPNDTILYEKFWELKKNMEKEKEENSQTTEEMKKLLKTVCLKYEAIKFGDFTLKSGLKSKYFFSSGSLNNSLSLNIISYLIADLIIKKGLSFDYILGASYKGIPIGALTCHFLSEKKKQNIFYIYDRKEEKKHGDKGVIIGLPEQISNEKKKVIVIDDVFTCGTAATKIVDTLKSFKHLEVCALIVLFNRNEYKLNERNEKIYYSNLFQEKLQFPMYSILNYEDDFHSVCKN